MSGFKKKLALILAIVMLCTSVFTVYGASKNDKLIEFDESSANLQLNAEGVSAEDAEDYPMIAKAPLKLMKLGATNTDNDSNKYLKFTCENFKPTEIELSKARPGTTDRITIRRITDNLQRNSDDTSITPMNGEQSGITEATLSEASDYFLTETNNNDIGEYVLQSEVSNPRTATLTIVVNSEEYNIEIECVTHSQGQGDGNQGIPIPDGFFAWEVSQELQGVFNQESFSLNNGQLEFAIDVDEYIVAVGNEKPVLKLSMIMPEGKNPEPQWYQDRQSDEIPPVYNDNKITYSIPLDKDSNIYDALVNQGHGEGGEFGIVIEGDGEYRLHYDIHPAGGGGEPISEYPGFFVSNRPLFVRIEGWEEDFASSFNGGLEAVFSNIPSEMTVSWDSGANAYWLIPQEKFKGVYDFDINLSEDAMRMIYRNTDVSQGISIITGYDYPFEPVENCAVSSVGYSDFFAQGLVDELQNLRQSAMTESPDYHRNPMNGLMNYMLVDREKRGNVTTLTPREYKGYMNVCVWYDEQGEPYNMTPEASDGNEAYIEIARLNITQSNKNSIVIDESNEFALGKHCFDTSEVEKVYNSKFEKNANKSIQFKNNRLTYYLSEKKLKDPKSYQDKPMITKVDFADADGPIELTIGDYSQTVDNPVEICADIVNNNSGKPTFCRDVFFPCSAAYIDKNGESQIRHFSIDHVVIPEKTAYEDAGWHPIPKKRFEPSPAYILNSGKSRGFTIEYISDGEFGHKWTGSPVDLSGLNELAEVLISPPSSSDLKGGKLKGWRCAQSEGERFFDPDEAFVSTVKGRLDANTINPISENGQPIVYRFGGYVPKVITAGGLNFYTLFRMNDDIDSSSWHFIDWIYEKNGQDYHWYDYFYLTTHDEHTEIMMSDATADKLGYPTIRSLSENFEVTMAYYPGGDTGTSRAALMELEAIDRTGHSPSKDNKVRIRISYPEGISFLNYKKSNISLLHFVDGLEGEPVEEEIVFKPEGMIVELSSCSPFLMTWDAVDGGDMTRTHSSGGGSSYISKAPVPKPAVTPIIKDAKGNQIMGMSIISKPVNTLTETEKSFVRSTGYIWTKSYDGFFQLKNTKGEVVRNEWALVPDSLWTNPVGNLSWFYFDENGYMLTGWQYIKGADGKYRLFYFNEEGNGLYGACMLGGTVDGKTLDADGHVVENGVVKEWAYKPQ